VSAVRVWDPLVRVVHWTLAALIAYELFDDAGANPWHRYLGYAAGALVAVRLAWGIAGPRYARLTAIACRAVQAPRYLLARVARDGRPYAAHTPPGALMALVLWVLTIFVVLTGWMLQLDAFWGDEVLQRVHTASAYVLAGFAGVHIAGAVVTSIVTRTNLVKAMFTGSKRAADERAAS
jgi:cytochrome b